MSYLSIYYLFLVIPAVVIIYSIVPKKFRYIFLLLVSFALFFYISKKLIVILFITILTTYISALFINKLEEKKELLLNNANSEEKKEIKNKFKFKKKLLLIIYILINVSFLVAYKYLNFFSINTNLLLKLLHIDYSFKIIRIVAPIGISFWLLTALSYVIDVYNGKVEAEKNPLKVALYISYFATLIEGPFTRYADIKDSMFAGNNVTYDNLCRGYQRIMFGLFKKMVIADRLNILVKIVFDNYIEFSGFSSLLGTIAYTVMLYMEFSGTMDVVIGSSEILGINIKENFRQPFFSKNISEFWTRWHISLGTWFRDYIFYPISLSKPMKKLTISARKKLGNHFGPLISGSIALFVVWFLNGLWHGAGYTFLAFGLFHFLMILLGNIFTPLIIKICNKLNINRENIIYRVFQSIKMAFLVFIGEIFFRADTMQIALGMIKKIFTDWSIRTGEISSLGLDIYDYIALLIGITFVFVISIFKEKNIDVRNEISKKPVAVRWALYYILIFSIFLLGAFGHGYVPVDPMYADF